MDALREPVVPVEPDPHFAAALRARLERALLDPGRTPLMTTTIAEVTLHTLTPMLGVSDARRALEFYVAAFGAVPRGEPIVMDDGRIGHAELAIGDSVLMLADEFPELGLLGPAARGGPSQSLRLEVSDVDRVVERAVALGAELERPPGDSLYGRIGVVLDPFGHRWMVSSPAPAPTSGPRHGDVGYASLWTPDVERAAAFYGAVLGWRYAPGSAPQGRQVDGLRQHIGIWGGQEPGTTFLCFAVDDVDAAVVAVRAAGGSATEPTDEPYGRVANCLDDQGMPFAVYTDPGGTAAPADPRPGEISYLTVEVPDSRRTRAFFATVLGWRFRAGRVPEGWQVEDVRPMTGLHGGHDQVRVVPMYAVADVEAAVTAVRAAGGTATDPQRQPYGRIAECTDDQGTRFFLGEV